MMQCIEEETEREKRVMIHPSSFEKKKGNEALGDIVPYFNYWK